MHRIFILDPGFSELAGHHLGFLRALDTDIRDDLHFHVLSHVSLRTVNYSKFIGADNFSVVPFFQKAYYSYSYDPGVQQTLHVYANELATEYFAAIKHILMQYPDEQEYRFLYHSLDHIHARALTLALALIDQQYPDRKLQSLVLCLYHPCAAPAKTETIARQNYRLGFGGLYRRPDVTLYAADREISELAGDWLPAGKDIPLHPCSLLPVTNDPKPAARKQILLYLGDAKEEKGFMQLPSLLAQIATAESFSDYRFVIHFTLENLEVARNRVAKELEDLADTFDNVIVQRGFLDQDQVAQLIASSSAIVMNYCRSAYEFKNSGVLWLAGYYDVPIVFLTDTWLNREALRLDLKNEKMDVDGLVALFSGEGGSIADLQRGELTEQQQSYREALFKPFLPWLIDELAIPAPVKFQGE